MCLIGFLALPTAAVDASHYEDLLAAQEVMGGTMSALPSEPIRTDKQDKARLSDPNLMRRPEVRASWHAARRELGLEE